MSKIKKLVDAKYVNIDDIVVGQRLRKDSPQVRATVESIAQSIKELGPLQPLVLDEKNNLIDGGCRYQAYKSLGVTEVPCVRRVKVSEAGKLALEVEANLRRSDLTWSEKVEAIAKYHKLKSDEADEDGAEWSQRATGSLLKVQVASVNNALQIWPYLEKGDPEICGAESLKAAQEVLLERKKAQAIKQALVVSAMSNEAVGVKAVTPNKTVSPMVFSLGKAEDKVEIAPSAGESRQEVKAPPSTIDLSKRLFNVDCVEWMSNAPKDSVDVIVTDIPYGVDLDNMEDIKNIDMMRSTHDVEENVDLMPKFLKAAYRVMKPNSYLLFFYALQHHEKLRDAGKDVGFKVQDWPLLWLKPHSCKNNAPQQNWTKSFEPMMVMKKGSPILPTPMTKCHLEVDGMPDKKMQSNPFAKPLLWLSEMVFKPLAFKPGSIMLDPFAGEGSILTAGVLHGLDVIGLELDTERFPALVSRMQRFYSKLLNNNVNFVLP